jgi:hypothetical protein
MTQPPASPRRRRSRNLVIAVVVFAILGGAAIPVLGILAAVAIPNFIQYQTRAMRAEVPMNIAGIRVAELAYRDNFGVFYPIPEPIPLDPVMLGRRGVDWPGGTPFDTLGWSTTGTVRGTYWVTVSEDGQDFEVHGLCDLDEDGEPAHYTATRELGVTMQTPTYVF